MSAVTGVTLPEPSDLTRPFWDSCRQGVLRVQQCAECGRKFFTPLPACPACLSRNWSWVQSPGTGTIYSFSVVNRPARPDRAVPYVIAIIDLDDGWTMLSNVVDCDPASVRCGQRVAVRFLPVSEQIHLPAFTRLESVAR